MISFGISLSNMNSFMTALESNFQQCFQALQRQYACLVRRQGYWR